MELVSGTNAYFSQTNFFNDATSVAARFVFTNAVHGLYNVVLTNPDTHSTTARQVITIETAVPLTAQVVPGLVNYYPRVGLPFEWNGVVVNSGNVDIQYLTVVVGLNQFFPITLEPPLGVVSADTNSTDNTSGVCSFLSRDISPNGSLDFSFVVSGFGSQSFLLNIIPVTQYRSDFLQLILNEAEDAHDMLAAITNILESNFTNAGSSRLSPDIVHRERQPCWRRAIFGQISWLPASSQAELLTQRQ